jgi:5-carboxymethyl-2-hydroxymuconate isomerase
MPHFVIHSNKTFIDQQDPNKIMQTVFEQAKASGLFPNSIIKVRIAPFEHSIVDGEDQDLIHIIAWIMGGRTNEQKKDLADKIIEALVKICPQLPMISIDMRDIDPATYSNREMI